MVSLIEMPQTLSQQLPRQSDRPADETDGATIMIDVRDLDFAYGGTQVLFDVSLDIPPQAVTAFIGPTGCGKTTLLRCINRMNDLIENARITRGAIRLGGVDINAAEVDVVDLRRRVGMVFQKSNPFSQYASRSRKPTGCGLPASPKNRAWMKQWRRVCAPRRFGTRSRTASTRARLACLADNSNAFASRGRWQWNRTLF